MSDQSPQAVLEEDQRSDTKELIINDFSIQVATVNGSGSQSSNTVLMRSIFQMGIPVSGKNLFPSNIAGLPTWFTIRAPYCSSASDGSPVNSTGNPLPYDAASASHARPDT